MKIKKGVILVGLKIEMRPVLVNAEAIWKEYGKVLTVTCGLDGVHSAGSFHYYGWALDFRSYYFKKAVKLKVANKLKKILGCNYDVIIHKTHIHAEYDPK